ncbi:MAG: 4-hydroxythreonine-4-phosphate dehydrogenase PdxA [Bacteroidales bacterium]|nr:4-hydroxythreonine-4-phosphate dehydrogenase PdxA [Bacteroidales bacterium]
MIDEQDIKSGDKVRVGITHGDYNSISYEIILKTFQDIRILDFFTPIIYGSSKIASYFRKTLNIPDVNLNLIKKADYANPKRVNIVNCFEDEVKIEVGKMSRMAGELSYYALEKAVEDIRTNKIDVLVTGPINKKNIQSDKFGFSGHTDYLAHKFNTDNHLMMMVSNNLRIGILTGHIPLSAVREKITKELVLNKIRVMCESLKNDFNTTKPKIAILGLNPHAGDDGLIGSEEKDIISPAIEMAKKENFLAFGPFPADGFFGSLSYMKYDGVLAMYHDQGMIPFKAIAFDEGVNYTAGLPVVRTSPAHGTAFDIAGKNIASEASIREAIYLGIQIFKNRKLNSELNKNPLPLKITEEQPQHNEQNSEDKDLKE